MMRKYFIRNPGNMDKINALYVYLSSDENGNEGIMAKDNYPFIFRNKEFFLKFKRITDNISAQSGIKIISAIFKREK